MTYVTCKTVPWYYFMFYLDLYPGVPVHVCTCIHVLHVYTPVLEYLYYRYMFILFSFFSFSRINACKWQITAKDNPVEFNYKDAHN